MISINEILKKTYGEKVYKIPINLGLSCPNRDGTKGSGGCIFCSAEGSGDFCAGADLSIKSQMEEYKLKLKNKAGNVKKFIAYFQAYTNTYGDPKYLEKVYFEAAECDEIVGISIGTRPDCLPDEILKILDKLNKTKPVWVELGLQTSNEKTAEFINRCYENKVYEEAVKNLKAIGINVVTHVIIGLPGETEKDVLATVTYVKNCGSDGIKLQVLNVLKGTRLADIYEKEPFKILTLEEYRDIVKECLEIIGDDVTVHRLTGDGPRDILIEPKWILNKKKVLNMLK